MTDSQVSGTTLPNTTTVTFTPGFRTHLGANFFLRGGVEVPATNPPPFDYQVLATLLEAWCTVPHRSMWPGVGPRQLHENV